MTNRRHRQTRLPGFTLVELLVAMSITSIIVLVLFGLVGQTTTNYRFSQRKITTLSDARAFLQFIEAELTGRISHTKFHWQQDSLTSSRCAFTITRAAEEFLANPAEGDLSTVVYYLDFTPDDLQRSSFKVFRKKLDAATTQQLLEQQTAAPFPTVNPSTDEAILYNCLTFSLKPLRRLPTGAFQPWTASDLIAPDAVELTLEIIDDFSSQKLRSAPQWLALASTTDPRARESVQTFTRLIPLQP